MKKRLGGFTLLELLLILIVVGILLVALYPNVIDAQDRARDTTRKVDLAEVAKALNLYGVDHEMYPSIEVATTHSGYASIAPLFDVLSIYIKSLPQDSGHGVQTAILDGSCVNEGDDYAYYVTDDGNRFSLTSYMESHHGNTSRCDGVLDGQSQGFYYVVSSGKVAQPTLDAEVVSGAQSVSGTTGE